MKFEMKFPIFNLKRRLRPWMLLLLCPGTLTSFHQNNMEIAFISHYKLNLNVSVCTLLTSFVSAWPRWTCEVEVGTENGLMDDLFYSRQGAFKGLLAIFI